MAVKAGTAYVDIEGDFSGLNKQVSRHFSKMGKQASGTGKKIGRTLGVGMAAGIAGVAIAGKQLFDFGKDAVGIASDVNESITKNQVLFGKYAKDIESFAKRSGNAFGISRKSALEYTGTFGNLFNALGISNKESAKFSTGLVKLAADMASFNNSSPEEALEAIRSGLVGETEPLRRFGVNMNDATLKAQAMKMGLIKTTKEALTPQTKALAAQALITKQTSAAHGDFAKTSDGLANSQRRLKARWEDMKGTLGDALLPAVTNVSGALLDIADDVQPKVQRAISNITRIFGRKDLSFGEKIQRSWDAVKLEFGPMAADLVQGIRDLNLDDKLADVVRAATPKIAAVAKTVGTAVAKAVWEGFQAAPLWAKVGGGIWLANKLGIAGPAFKKMFGWLTAGGGGGVGGLSMRGATPATPLYVIVENWAKIAAGAAAGGATVVGGTPWKGKLDPKAGGGGNLTNMMKATGAAAGGAAAATTATSFASKFKSLGPKLLKGAGIGAGIAIGGELASGLVGEVVGGKSGEKIKSIGSRAAMWGGIGATAGTLIAPGIGTAIGGAGGAILGGLSTLLSKKETGDKILDSVNDGLKKAGADTTLQVLTTEDIDKQIKDASKRFEEAQPKRRPAGPYGPAAVVRPEDKAAAAKAATDLGTAFTDKFKLTIDQAKFWSPESFQKQADAITRDPNLPLAARKQAAIQMSTYAMELQRQGRLPKGAAQTIVANFEQQFGKLPFIGRKAGDNTMQALKRSLGGQQVIGAIRSNITKWHSQFGGLPNLGTLTGQNFTKNMGKYLGPNGFLTKQVQAGVKGANEAYRTLAEQSGRYLRRMTGSSAAAARELSKAFGGQGAAGSIRAWREQIVSTDPVLQKHEDRLVSAKNKLRNLKKGSEEYNTAQKKVRVEQKIINDRLLNTIDVAPDTREELRKLKVNFMNLGGSAEEAAGLIAAATNMVLAGLGADTIRFSLKMSQKLKSHPHQRGGPIPGVGLGDKYPALLEAGEYVVNRKAVKKVGKAALDRLNFGDAPRFQTGGIVELLHPFNDPEGHGGSNSHLHIAMSTIAGIIALGKKLQRLGWLVGENPAFGGIQGNHSATGWHPKGLAIDVNWPDAAAEGAKIKALLPSLGGDLGALLQAPKIPRIEITGPSGMMRTVLSATTGKMRDEAQDYVDAQASSMEGVETGSSVNVSGNGADLMRQISKQRGWNFADWWKLDERESGHGTNLTNPESSARLRGQFLDMNWGKYGPGSDPRQNPSMGQQIYSMAAYIAERYGNPTSAWSAWMSHYPPGWYSRGGLAGSVASLFKTGGSVPWQKRLGTKKEKPPKVTNKWFKKLSHSKSHKPGKHSTLKAIKKLDKTGPYGKAVMAQLADHENWVDTYADWAQRANDITNTDALQLALNAQMTTLIADARAKGQTVDFSEAGLARVFPLADQDAFIQGWLRQNAVINGGTQSDWLSAELGRLYQWRNLIIDNGVGTPSVFDGYLADAKKAYAKVKAELKLVVADIAKFVRLRAAAIERRKQHQEKIEELDKEKDKELKQKKKGYRGRVEKIDKKIHDHRVKRHDAQEDVERYNRRLSVLRDVRGRWRKQARIFGGDAGGPGDTGQGESGYIFKFQDAKDAMATNLNEIHGLGTTNQKFWSSDQYPLGLLGGTILNVQNEISGLTANPPRATAEDTTPDTSAAEEQTKELLSQLLREANLRTAVSNAQFDVFRDLPTTFGNYPFGGFFQEGGPVPGPVGAPRMIVAHGGEYVVPNDGAGMGTHVSLHFASGMEWLKQFVDVRVENQTRTQGRRGERGLPGRAGLLTR